ncbi:putative serine/threonine-protein kinase CCRP1 [Smittium culicis]|uniref:Serine/threonine-protein kinase n=1 Tax=Smittium culicis TaxID=133412 RepID=A0A1R1YB91_9FUNG|nr:putative serine/threonine-protein kinase CCRP1 [Smittium culicis]
MSNKNEIFTHPDGVKISKIISDPSNPNNLYEIIEVLGVGSFGKCYRVVDLISKTDEWACKVLEKSSITTPKIKERIQFEVSIVQSLPRHQRIAYGHKVFQDQTKIYIIMELCSKYTMETLIRQRKRLTEFEARYFFIQAVEGIVELHRRRIIHRDIKLANILLNKKNQVKIGDFGLSALLESRADRKTSFLGTLNYLSPEVVLRAKKGHSFGVDVWALGVYLYVMLVGKTPFAPKQKPAKPEHYYKEICQGKIEFPHELNLSDDAKDLILQLCQRPEEKRIKTNQIKFHPWVNNHVASTPETMPESIFLSPIDPTKWNKFIESKLNQQIDYRSSEIYEDSDIHNTNNKTKMPTASKNCEINSNRYTDVNGDPRKLDLSTTTQSNSDRGSDKPFESSTKSDNRANINNMIRNESSYPKKPVIKLSKLRNPSREDFPGDASYPLKSSAYAHTTTIESKAEYNHSSYSNRLNNNDTFDQFGATNKDSTSDTRQNGTNILEQKNTNDFHKSAEQKLNMDSLVKNNTKISNSTNHYAIQNRLLSAATGTLKNNLVQNIPPDPNNENGGGDATTDHIQGTSDSEKNDKNDYEENAEKSPEKKKVDINSLFRVWQAKLEVLSHRFNFYLKETTANKKVIENHPNNNPGNNIIIPIHLTRFVRVPKYGLGYELSNGTFGVSFRDKTSLLCLKDSQNPLMVIANKSRVEIKQLPQMDQIKGLEQKVALYSQFKVAVKEQPLTKHAQRYIKTTNVDSVSPYVFVTKYLSATNVSMYRISNGTIQVCFKDGTQLLLFDDNKITFTDKSVSCVTFDIRDSSSDVFREYTFNHGELISRINYTSKILEAVT